MSVSLSKITRQCILYALLALLFYLSWLWINHSLSIQTWQIYSNNDHLAQQIESELQTIENLDFIRGTPSLLRKELLQKIPDLLDLKVTRFLPSTLHIEAVARTPVLLWKKDHVFFLIDKTGYPYRQMLQHERFDLPLLRVEETQLQQVTQLILLLQKYDLSFYQSLSECRSLYDDSLKLYFNQRQTWLLPSGELAQQHLAKLITLLQNRRWREGKWKVDARQEKRWFIRQAQYGGVI